jgi:hypothetical protein
MSNSDVKIYIITFGVAEVNLAALNQYLFDSSDIIAFWNYVPLVYCVKSRATATELAYKLTPFFPNGNFFIAEINPNNANGMLPEPAWEWFYLDHHDKHRPPALTTGLSGLESALGLGSALTRPTFGLGLGGLLNPPQTKK